MRKSLPLLAGVALTLVLSACAKKCGGTTETATAPAQPTATAALSRPSATLEIGTKDDEIAYDKTTLEAKTGTVIAVRFKNNAKSPQNKHNWVLTKPGMAQGVAGAGQAAHNGEKTGFIPNTPDMIAHTKLLKPGEEDTIIFTVPPAGEYSFVCTVPGHEWKMVGVFKATKK